MTWPPTLCKRRRTIEEVNTIGNIATNRLPNNIQQLLKYIHARPVDNCSENKRTGLVSILQVLSLCLCLGNGRHTCGISRPGPIFYFEHITWSWCGLYKSPRVAQPEDRNLTSTIHSISDKHTTWRHTWHRFTAQRRTSTHTTRRWTRMEFMLMEPFLNLSKNNT